MSQLRGDLVVLKKGQTLFDYEESFRNDVTIPGYWYSVEDVADGCRYRTITCWKNAKTVFDVSKDHEELMESYAIHERWHAFQAKWAPQSDEESNLCQAAYLDSLTEEQRLAEYQRSERMSEFFDDEFRRSN